MMNISLERQTRCLRLFTFSPAILSSVLLLGSLGGTTFVFGASSVTPDLVVPRASWGTKVSFFCDLGTTWNMRTCTIFVNSEIAILIESISKDEGLDAHFFATDIKWVRSFMTFAFVISISDTGIASLDASGLSSISSTFSIIFLQETTIDFIAIKILFG